MATFEVTVGGNVTIKKANVSGNAQTKGPAVGGNVSRSSYPYYDGEYEFAPSQEIQVVSTEGKILKHDIVIDPVPENYGLITWNGSVLTVS